VRSRSPTLCRLLFALQGIYLSLGMGHQSGVPLQLWNKSSAESHIFIHSYSRAKPMWSSPQKLHKLNKRKKVDKLLKGKVTTGRRKRPNSLSTLSPVRSGARKTDTSHAVNIPRQALAWTMPSPNRSSRRNKKREVVSMGVHLIFHLAIGRREVSSSKGRSYDVTQRRQDSRTSPLFIISGRLYSYSQLAAFCKWDSHHATHLDCDLSYPFLGQGDSGVGLGVGRRQMSFWSTIDSIQVMSELRLSTEGGGKIDRKWGYWQKKLDGRKIVSGR